MAFAEVTQPFPEIIQFPVNSRSLLIRRGKLARRAYAAFEQVNQLEKGEQQRALLLLLNTVFSVLTSFSQLEAMKKGQPSVNLENNYREMIGILSYAFHDLKVVEHQLREATSLQKQSIAE